MPYRNGRWEYTEEDRLRDEVEQLQESQRKAYEQRSRELEQHRREFRERAEENMRTADNWPEALQKQVHLFRREAAQWADDEDPDTLFGPGADACERALEIWREIAAEKKATIDELEAQIALILDSIRVETADRLESESKGRGWKFIAESLRTDTPENFLYW